MDFSCYFLIIQGIYIGNIYFHGQSPIHTFPIISIAKKFVNNIFTYFTILLLL